MKRFLIPLFFVASSAYAYETNDGRYPVDMTKNFTNTTTVTFKAVDDVDKACNVERVSRGYQKNKVKVDACSFWTGNQCVIVTGKTATLEIIGHEMTHCIQGGWHP
jgi:hypothetical protein